MPARNASPARKSYALALLAGVARRAGKKEQPQPFLNVYRKYIRIVVSYISYNNQVNTAAAAKLKIVPF
ncbi:MAG: hypothetical protein ABII72_00005, partial [Parcubacteria group bacterium]